MSVYKLCVIAPTAATAVAPPALTTSLAMEVRELASKKSDNSR
jgi:hypothetical protein